MNDLDKKIEDFYNTQNMTLNILPSKLLVLAKSGDIDAMYDFANTLTSLPEGLLTSEEDSQAFFWMKKASENGNEEALGHMAMLYITGENKWLVKDEDKGKKILLELKNSKSDIVQNFIYLFDETYFKFETKDRRDSYLQEKISGWIDVEIPKFHNQFLLKAIPKAVELAEEFISNKDIKKDDRELFTQYLNEHVLTNIFHLDSIILLKELLKGNPHAKKEVLVQWVKMRNNMNPREDYMSLKGLTLDQIKMANFN